MSRPALFVSVLLFGMGAAQAAVPVSGRWYTDNKDSIIEIGQCGPVICGKVAKIIAPTPDGKPAIDSNNPDPALRKRPILGMTLLSNFKDNGADWAGQIYDPRAGRTYKSTMTKLANGNLRVKGCWGPFCRSVYFTPVK
jgi:uncharacterized protein (DUF2147 family)